MAKKQKTKTSDLIDSPTDVVSEIPSIESDTTSVTPSNPDDFNLVDVSIVKDGGEPIKEQVIEDSILSSSDSTHEIEIVELPTEEPVKASPEPVTVPDVQPLRRIGRFNVTAEFLRSTPTFFTWLHKQGYAILNREAGKHGDTIFIIEGGQLESVSGDIPEYIVSSGNRLAIRKK